MRKERRSASYVCFQVFLITSINLIPEINALRDDLGGNFSNRFCSSGSNSEVRWEIFFLVIFLSVMMKNIDMQFCERHDI